MSAPVQWQVVEIDDDDFPYAVRSGEFTAAKAVTSRSARLIAASPVMLDALKAARPWLECHPDKNAYEAERRVLDAIAKARGHD
jgi:hypothetical protein